jgi:ADP-heptose:LPS heptosyltransferase
VRILIVRAGALGDVLLLRTTLHALRCAGHRITLVTPSQPASVLTGEVEAVIPWEGRDVAGLLTTASGDSPPAFAGHDLALAFTRSAALLSALERFVPVRSRDPLPPKGVHAARWALEAVSDLVATDLALPSIAATLECRAPVEPLLAQLGAQFLAIHPGSGSPAKSWPRQRYRALADSLTTPDERFLVVEGPADRVAASVFDGNARAVFARDLDLPSLGALLAQARLLIGNDSGVAHLAAAFGAPCLVLFGPTDPRQWSPVGARVQTLSAATLEALSLERVLEAAEPLASRSKWSGRELPSG